MFSETLFNYLHCFVGTTDNYEQKGQDYPIAFVRWTEKRNFEAILSAIESGQIDVEPLITERVPLAEYSRIYDNMSGSSSIASLLVYEGNVDTSSVVTVTERSFSKGKGIEDGGWRTEDGGWRTEDGGRRMEDGGQKRGENQGLCAKGYPLSG